MSSNSAGYYVDGGLGFANSNVNILGDSYPYSNGFAGVVFFGYQFNSYFATEAGYNYASPGYSLFPLAIKGILPLGADKRFKLFGKLGPTLTNSSVEPFLGLGAGYAVTPNLDVAIEMNGTTTPSSGMSSTTINCIYHF
jgi:hypothetical protein